MELLFLGTGSGVPSKQRNTQSIALKMLNERNEVWMFDCGEATQHQILKTTLKPRKVSKIFISHMHGDHIYGLAGFLSSRAFQGGEEAVTVYGPKGIKQYVMMSLKLSKTYLRYYIHFVEYEDEEGILFEDEDMLVTYQLLDHGIDCFGFRIMEKTKPGHLLVDKLEEDGIPSGPIYGKLKAGQTVELEDGRIIDGQDYIGPQKEGKIIAIIPDTRPTPLRFLLAKDADVLVHESTFSQDEEGLAMDYHHSTNLDAAHLAKDAGVKQLLLTHISSRYIGPSAKELESQAQKVFPNTHLMYDLMEVDLS